MGSGRRTGLGGGLVCAGVEVGVEEEERTHEAVEEEVVVCEMKDVVTYVTNATLIH